MTYNVFGGTLSLTQSVIAYSIVRKMPRDSRSLSVRSVISHVGVSDDVTHHDL